MFSRRLTTVVLATMSVLLLFSGTAFAHYCTNVSKQSTAGNAGTVFLDLSENEDGEIVLDKTTARLTKSGQVAGGFFNIHLDFDGDGVADLQINGIYAHAALPAGALLAAGCGQATETYEEFFEGHC